MARKPTPSAERLREAFDYEPLTGRLVNRITRNSRSVAGSIAGCERVDGYWTVTLDGETYQQHTIVYKWMYGIDPEFNLDHRDDVKSNNQIWNLRPKTYRENLSKARAKEKKSGLPTGVVKRIRKTCIRYEAAIMIDGLKTSLGCFGTPEEASLAYQSAIPGGDL